MEGLITRTVRDLPPSDQSLVSRETPMGWIGNQCAGTLLACPPAQSRTELGTMAIGHLEASADVKLFVFCCFKTTMSRIKTMNWFILYNQEEGTWEPHRTLRRLHLQSMRNRELDLTTPWGCLGLSQQWCCGDRWAESPGTLLRP